MMGRDPLTPLPPSPGTTTNTAIVTGWWTSSVTCSAKRSEVGVPLLCLPVLPVQNLYLSFRPRLPGGRRAPCSGGRGRWATCEIKSAHSCALCLLTVRGGVGGGRPRVGRLPIAPTPRGETPAQAQSAALRAPAELMTSARQRRGLRSQKAARAAAEAGAPGSGSGARRAR